MCQSLFFNKIAGTPATLLKKRLWNRCFPVNFAKFLRTTFSLNMSGRLLLIFLKKKRCLSKLHTTYKFLPILIEKILMKKFLMKKNLMKKILIKKIKCRMCLFFIFSMSQIKKKLSYLKHFESFKVYYKTNKNIFLLLFFFLYIKMTNNYY